VLVNKSFYPGPRSFSTVTSMQRQMEQLQLQLASGKRFNSLAEYGTSRTHDLNLRARLGRIEGYEANVTTTENRLSFLNNAIERLDEIEADARALAVPSAYGSDGLNMVNASQQAGTMLKEVIDLLNTDIAGQFIFGGHVSDKRPLSSFDQILHGDAIGRAGFSQVATERKAADLGTAGLGRLTMDAGGTATATLSEDGAHPFGFKLASMAGGGTYATISQPNGTAPQSVGVTFTDVAALKAGDTITVGVTYPDDRNRVEYVTFTATTDDPPGKGQYLIGDTPEATAANFAAAMETKFADLGKTSMASASTAAAADNFFNTKGEPVLRVVDNAPDDPVALSADTAYASTVRWYNGQVESTDPRGTVTTQIDETTRVRVGVTADESGFATLIKTLASFAISDFTTTDNETSEETAQKRAQFDAMSGIARVRLSEERNTTEGSIESIALELGLAAHTVGQVKTRHAEYGGQLKTMLAEIEQAPIEEVAMQLMTLRTRLEASFQATTMVSQLTLVNFLR